MQDTSILYGKLKSIAQVYFKITNNDFLFYLSSLQIYILGVRLKGKETTS